MLTLLRVTTRPRSIVAAVLAIGVMGLMVSGCSGNSAENEMPKVVPAGDKGAPPTPTPIPPPPPPKK